MAARAARARPAARRALTIAANLLGEETEVQKTSKTVNHGEHEVGSDRQVRFVCW